MPAISHTRSALILYATETGTAQDIAFSLRPLLAGYDFRIVEVIPADDLPEPRYLRHYSLCIFVTATTGQGDIANNARKFWRMLRRRSLTKGEELQGVNFASIGLGDRSYLKFNWAARMLQKRLQDLGANQIFEACEADESAEEGVEGDVNEWLARFSAKLGELWPANLDEPRVDFGPKWLLSPVDMIIDDGIAQINGSIKSRHINGAKKRAKYPRPMLEGQFPVALTLNERLTPPDHWQDVRHLRFHTEQNLDYLPGDALYLLPENDPQDIEVLLELMGWTTIADEPVRLTPASSEPDIDPDRVFPSLENPPFPHLTQSGLDGSPATTLREIFQTTLDIRAVPRRAFFGTLARYCTADDAQRERLLEFTDPQYLDEYFDYATRPRRSILEILQEFKDGLRIPWQHVLEVFPPLRGRLFSIASSKGATDSIADSSARTNGHPQPVPQLQQQSSGTTFELLIAIVKYRTVIRRIRRGVCTHWLESLPVGARIHVALRSEGRFHKHRSDLLRPEGTSHILVGAGTGLAPLRSLAWEKEMVGLHRLPPKHETGNEIEPSTLPSPSPIQGETLLVFGARNTAQDFFFQHEWKQLQQGPYPQHNPTPASLPNKTPATAPTSSFQLITAFSRDQSAKIYVQDRIRENHDKIARMILHEHATIVLCGSSGAMPKAVRQAVVDVLTRELVQEDAERYVAAMQKGGRWIQETW